MLIFLGYMDAFVNGRALCLEIQIIEYFRCIGQRISAHLDFFVYFENTLPFGIKHCFIGITVKVRFSCLSIIRIEYWGGHYFA